MMTTTMKLSLSNETTSSSKHVYYKRRCWSPVLPLAWESSSWFLCFKLCHGQWVEGTWQWCW
jgi:hypothetical protein